jgi:L-fuculose-phosphate aldolase
VRARRAKPAGRPARPGDARRNRAALKVDVAWAGRILAMHGHGDLTLGHVSARSGDRVLIKRKGLGLEEVAPRDIQEVDLDGRKIAGPGNVHLEVVLHAEVYRARPDVGAVIHTHPIHSTAFGATNGTLRYLTHDALLFPDGLGLFESADLVTTAEGGRALAQALGPRRAVLLRNHGTLVVGRDLPWAVLAALTLERALHIQAVAASLGALRPMPELLVEPLFQTKYRDAFIVEYWDYWLRLLRDRGLAKGMPARRAPRA